MTNMIITKAILSTGDLMVHANGKMSTLIRGTIGGDILRFHTEFNSFSSFDNYTDDLTHVKHNGLDVVKVYRSTSTDISKCGDDIFNPDKMVKDENLFGVITRIPYMSGDMFVHANGKVSTLFKGVAGIGDILRYHTDYNSFSYLDKFDLDTGKHVNKNGLDIVKVYRTTNDDPKKFGDDIANPDKMVKDENLIKTFIVSSTEETTEASSAVNTSREIAADATQNAVDFLLKILDGFKF